MNSDGAIDECSTKLCGVTIYSDDDGEMSISQFCANNDYLKSAGLWFTAEFNPYLNQMTREYEFHCSYYGCNDESTITNAIDLFYEEYDFESILERFGYSDDDKEEEETTISSTSQQQTDSVQSSAITNPVASTSTTSSAKSISTTSSIKSTPTASSVKSISTTSSIKSSPTASSVKPATITNSATKSYINDTVTTITTEANHGLHRKGSDTIIYIAQLISIAYLLFLP